MYENIIRFLVELKADQLEHSDRTLLEHLDNTYHLLKDYNQNEELALAGLCHSIYGTCWLEEGLLPISRRITLRKLIGRDAENLVYLNSALPQNFWSRILTLRRKYFFYLNRWNNTVEEIAPEIFSYLVCIEFINRIELLAHAGSEKFAKEVSIIDDMEFFLKAYIYMPDALIKLGKAIFKLTDEEILEKAVIG